MQAAKEITHLSNITPIGLRSCISVRRISALRELRANEFLVLAAANTTNLEVINGLAVSAQPLLASPYYCTTASHGFVGVLGKHATLNNGLIGKV